MVYCVILKIVPKFKSGQNLALVKFSQKCWLTSVGFQLESDL